MISAARGLYGLCNGLLKLGVQLGLQQVGAHLGHRHEPGHGIGNLGVSGLGVRQLVQPARAGQWNSLES